VSDLKSRMRRWPLAAVASLALLADAAQAATDPLAPTGRWTANTAGQAQTPPMGWSSWNAFSSHVDEAGVMGSAEALVKTGLAAKGYRYVNLDDGWWARRRADGRMLIRTDRFPSAATPDGSTSFRPLVQRLHGMGLKAGIYSDMGRNTCAQAYGDTPADLPSGTPAEQEVGLYGHIGPDVRLYFRDWGFDFLKVDGCGLRSFGPDSERVRSGRFPLFTPLIDMGSVARTDVPAVRGLLTEVGQAIARERPRGDYVYSLCIWGSADVRAWGKDVGDISRTSDDLAPIWGRMLTNFDSVSHRALYGHPGGWNDPDMLFIGSGDFDAVHMTEARSQFALWAMEAAPLIIGADLRSTPQPFLDIYGDTDLIAIDQDPAGNQATLAYDSDEVQVLVKTLANGDKAVAVFNRTDAPVDATLTAAQLKFTDASSVELTDLWTHAGQTFQGKHKLHLAPHQTLVFRARGERQLKDGLYLSETPGLVNPAVDGVVTPATDPTIHRALAPWGGPEVIGDSPDYAGWGGAQADSTPYGRALTVAGRRFDNGIGVLANSRLEVRSGGALRFTTAVGVDDSASGDRAAAVSFEVYGDGRLLARSAPMHWGQAAAPLQAEVAGVQLIELVARAAGEKGSPLPVTWGDAALITR
jgi:alpha-galactosidase